MKVILEHPQDFVGNIGDMITFTVSARGENLTYQWQYSASQSSWHDSTLNGCATPTLRLEFRDYRAGTQYRCVVTDAAGNSRTSMAATILEDAAAWRFTYNADGMRTKRTNGTDTYSYVYNGSQLSQMTVGSNTLRFFYDANGNPITVTYNGNLYYYVNNIQGDVVAILDGAGYPVVEYLYNAWGVLLETNLHKDDPIAQYNPLRYRGYVYDTETGLYYLQSRYYNPELGRFINADAFASTGQGILGNNMFTYCNNSAVNGSDPCGKCLHQFKFWEDCPSCARKCEGEKIYDFVVEFTAGCAKAKLYAEAFFEKIKASAGIGLGLYGETNILEAAGAGLGVNYNLAEISLDNGKLTLQQSYWMGASISTFNLEWFSNWSESGTRDFFFANENKFTPSVEDTTWTIYSAGAYLCGGFNVYLGFDFASFFNDLDEISRKIGRIFP